MKKIEGSPKSLKQLLQNTKYSIHYYQREYMWQRKHIEELIDDLTSEFLDYYVPGDNRQKVRKRQIIMRSDAKLPQPFASWSNSL